jgi:hypothetical protein
MDVGEDDRVAAIAIVDMRRDFSEMGGDLPTGAGDAENGQEPKTKATAGKKAAPAKRAPAASKAPPRDGKPASRPKGQAKASGNGAKPRPRSSDGGQKRR